MSIRYRTSRCDRCSQIERAATDPSALALGGWSRDLKEGERQQDDGAPTTADVAVTSGAVVEAARALRFEQA